MAIRNVLRPGMRGEVVKQLHKALAEVGCNIDASDAYTWVTAEAVACAQRLLSIEPADGLYSAETSAKLNELLKMRQARQPLAEEQITASVSAMVPVIRNKLLPMMELGLAAGTVDPSDYDVLKIGIVHLEHALAAEAAARK